MCKANARRLVSEASALLNHGGRAGLAFTFWSLAVEEYGKALIMDELATGKVRTRNTVRLRQRLFRGLHEKKFKKGFRRIESAVGNIFKHAVRVEHNVAQMGTTARHPSDQNWIVSVSPGSSGEFQDLTGGAARGRQASPGLRMELLYVDWDDARATWREPEPQLIQPGVIGHFTISRDDLRRAIDALNGELGP